MAGELSAPVAVVYGFLLVLARVGATFTFLPLPSTGDAAPQVKVILIVAITMALYPFWPAFAAEPSMPEYIGFIVAEAGFGLGIGLLVSVMSESLNLFGQITGLQAGYSLASMINPTTQADTTILSTLATTAGSLLFLGLGLHRVVIRIFASSLESHPPGKLVMSAGWSEPLIHTVAGVFSTGLRLSLPVIALLMMADLTLAMFGRVNSQLQLLSLSFPLKMLLAVAVMTVLYTLMPTVYESQARTIFDTASKLAR
jgi:flagellar biosynthetic protein FliR